MVQSFCKWSSALCVDLLHCLWNILDESWTSVKLGALDTARPISLGIHFVLHATKFKCVGKPPVKRFSSGHFMQTMTRFCWMLENTLEGKSGDRLPRKLFERSLSNLETHFGKIEFSNFISLTLRFTSSDSCRWITSCGYWKSKWPLTMLLLKIWEQIGPTSTFTKGPLVKENADQHKKYVKVVGEVSFSNHKPQPQTATRLW